MEQLNNISNQITEDAIDVVRSVFFIQNHKGREKDARHITTHLFGPFAATISPIGFSIKDNNGITK